MPFNALLRQLDAQGLDLIGAIRSECRWSFKTEQREKNAAPVQLAQVGKHLALAQRVKHSVIGNKEYAPAGELAARCGRGGCFFFQRRHCGWDSARFLISHGSLSL